MPGLTDEDRSRIRRFAEVPRYRRVPEMLCPDGDDDPSDGGEE